MACAHEGRPYDRDRYDSTRQRTFEAYTTDGDSVLVEQDPRTGDLLIVQRPPEDVGRRVNMRIHETGDRAHRRRRWWKDADLREYLAGPTTVASPAPPTIATPALSSARRVAWPCCVWASWVQPTWIPPGTRGLPQLSVNFHLGR